jgi:hypothetical protein
MAASVGSKHAGFEQFRHYPLFDTIFKRRTRRISKGIKEVSAGSLSWRSDLEPHPLTPLEQAVLISVTGVTGITMPDMPTKSESGGTMLGSPMIEAVGRSAGSPDNAQATVFFMIDDHGTYLLRKPAFGLSPGTMPSPDDLLRAAEAAKVRILDRRLDFPRHFPYYVGRNRFVSNLPGSTIFVPVMDMTRQYINGLMYLLSQEDGLRPSFIDDWNFYRWTGCRKWVKNGFLNKDLKLPLGMLGTWRIHIEADLLVQNLWLTIQAMGLGGWVHAAFPPQVLLGHPDVREQSGPGLGFEFVTPRGWRRLLRFLTPVPAWQANPVGLGEHLKAFCPPNYPDMASAIDAIVAQKYGPEGLYTKPDAFAPAFKPGLAQRFVEEVAHLRPEVIECAKDICTYIYETYGRFPAHVDAFHVPGIWIQAHHLALDYYDTIYRGGYTQTQADHDRLWHGAA